MCVQAILDEAGAEPTCCTLNHERELVVGRPEAFYFYTVDGRGPCFVFEGVAPVFLACLHHSWVFMQQALHLHWCCISAVLYVQHGRA